MVKRLIKILKNNSFFLFGARGVGKTRLVGELFDDDDIGLFIDLLEPSQFETLSLNPGELGARLNKIKDTPRWVVIDEVQKVPALLSVVHSLIERKLGFRFILTGSSSRKLKKTGADLLAGRVVKQELHPFIHSIPPILRHQRSQTTGILAQLTDETNSPTKPVLFFSALVGRLRPH
jgi:predicted AAA+ superfamily ATPase